METQMGRLEGKTAVVTGGSSGIGLASAKRFAAEGAFVYVFARRQAELEAAVTAIGVRAKGVQGDISKPEDLDRLFAAVRADKGVIDVLFANAADGNFAPLGAITAEQVDQVFGVNVKGTLFTVQKALPLLKAGSSIILTGSTTGTTGTAAFSVYGASKAAIRNFARSWAVDLKGTGIRVNVLVPGPTETAGLMGFLEKTGMKKALVDGLIAQTVLGRMGDPDETAAAALFLASDDSSFMTGSEVFVDGGQAQI
jgi:NAD(P)-dependent dehydrogenase (short-subunit alcohol dehydrogenase family)